jgi:serine/threonine protein kinase
MNWHDGVFYFTAYRNGSSVFLKYDSWFNFYTNEVRAYELLSNSRYKNYILPLLDYGNGCLIFPYVNHPTLDQFLSSSSHLNSLNYLQINRQLLDILNMLKTYNLIHRDLTLKNIFIDESFKLKVFDFFYCIDANNEFKDFTSWFGKFFVLKRLGHQIYPFTWDDSFSLNQSISNIVGLKQDACKILKKGLIKVC